MGRESRGSRKIRERERERGERESKERDKLESRYLGTNAKLGLGQGSAWSVESYLIFPSTI